MEKFEKIHERALSAAKQIRKSESDLLLALQEVDLEKVYLELGFSSLFKYAEEALKLSPINAYDFITVARRASEFPALMNAVQSQRVTVAKTRRICAVVNEENQFHWIRLAESLSHRELEREIAKTNPDAPNPDRSKFVGNDRIELRFDVPENTAKRFEEARDVVSQMRQSAASFADTLDEALDEFLGIPDSDAPELGTVPSSKLKKAVLRRDGRRCTFTAPDGRRCDSTRWLDVHHKIPRANGGGNEPENLVTLCSAHHRHLHSHSAL